MSNDAEVVEILARTICITQACPVICDDCARTAKNCINNLRDAKVLLIKPNTKRYESALAAAVNEYKQFLHAHKHNDKNNLKAMHVALQAMWRVTINN